MLPYIDMLREEGCMHKDITTRLTRSGYDTKLYRQILSRVHKKIINNLYGKYKNELDKIFTDEKSTTTENVTIEQQKENVPYVINININISLYECKPENN